MNMDWTGWRAVPALRSCAISALIVLTAAGAGAPRAEDSTPSYSPYVSNAFPLTVFWGDTHIHTEVSMDANSMGARLSQDQAYRFAKGEEVLSSTGVPMRLSRPLDFVVMADHAEFMGYFPLIRTGDPIVRDSGWGTYFDAGDGFQLLKTIVDLSLAEDMRGKSDELGLRQEDRVIRHVWHEVTAAADRHNDPGNFTAFIGYEWTSSPGGDNLHRNVIFRDGAERANQVLPFSSMDSQNPEALWGFLQEYEENTGGKALAIPHNGNLSNGRMFRDTTFEGENLSPEYAAMRAKWEPLVEVTQIKGDGESHPFLSPDDGFADFELWDAGNLGFVSPKESWMYQYEYARSALSLGLAVGDRVGSNPFRFGMIGSSDTHTSLGAVEEDNFSGKFASLEPHPRRISQGTVPGDSSSGRGQAIGYAASGYAAVWARENTRESLFDAMQRKETYASTGPRMVVRFFAGWNFQQDDDKRSDVVAHGYSRGVPMGGDLGTAPPDASPKFIVMASKDPMGAHLDRIQVIKGWVDSEGNTRERIFDVALSDDRKVDAETGMAPALKSTVDVGAATYMNSVGSPFLSTVWTDPEFDPRESAYYYARVIEIPTPRWSTYEAAVFGLTPPQGVPATIQERAYTSPIWYTP